MRAPSFLLFGFAMIGFAGCTQRPATPAESRQPTFKPGEIGSHLPTFSLKDLHGYEISSTELRGKVVLIDFWATWCQPCKKEMPGYQALLDKYKSRGFTVIGFKFDTMMDTEDPLLFVEKLGVRYSLAIASEEVKEKFGGIEGLPTTLIYDRQGILRNRVIGFEYTDVVESSLKPLL